MPKFATDIAPKVFENVIDKYQKLFPKFNEAIDISFSMPKTKRYTKRISIVLFHMPSPMKK